MKPDRQSRPPISGVDLRQAPTLAAPEAILEAAGGMGIEFEPGDVERLGRYLGMLLHVNTTTNLTSVTDPAEAWRRHILDSLSLLPLIAELPDGANVIDVGSGGGLPGLPLAITTPQVRFTLLEATGKKADFLRAVVAEMGLANVRVHQERAERAGQDRGERTGAGRINAHRESYDLVVARAVGRLNTLAELTIPFAKVGCKCALIKGEQADAEVLEAAEALKMLHAGHVGTIESPTGRIVVLTKISSTARPYPRGDGEPKRVPLGGKAAGKAGSQDSED
ncbi:MAG: 16S rRNA (guanine(527)-N(7))-methyltransferase RsmG [Phycisphaerales bacterium]